MTDGIAPDHMAQNHMAQNHTALNDTARINDPSPPAHRVTMFHVKQSTAPDPDRDRSGPPATPAEGTDTTKNPRTGSLRYGGSVESNSVTVSSYSLCARGDLNPHVPKDTGT